MAVDGQLEGWLWWVLLCLRAFLLGIAVLLPAFLCAPWRCHTFVRQAASRSKNPARPVKSRVMKTVVAKCTAFFLLPLPHCCCSARDVPRPQAAEAVALLQRSPLSCRVHLLSGDCPAAVAAVARAVGLGAEGAHGGLTPAEKLEKVLYGTALAWYCIWVAWIHREGGPVPPLFPPAAAGKAAGARAAWILPICIPQG